MSCGSMVIRSSRVKVRSRSANKRLARGSQAMVAYTLSKAEDSISDFINSPPQDQGYGRDPQDPDGLPAGFDPSRERGPSLQEAGNRT